MSKLYLRVAPEKKPELILTIKNLKVVLLEYYSQHINPTIFMILENQTVTVINILR